MSTNRTVAVSSPRQFARHHWTSLAFLILGLGLFVFNGIAHEVLEGDSMRFDRWLLLALRVPDDSIWYRSTAYPPVGLPTPFFVVNGYRKSV